MSKKPKPSLDIDTGVDLDLDRIDEMEALSILEPIGCETPDSEHVQLIQYTVARIQSDVEVDARKPSSADQAQTLKRLRDHLAKLDLPDALGPRQHALVEASLNRWNPPPRVSRSQECLTYFHDVLTVWAIGVQEGTLSVPRKMQRSFPSALNLLSRMNEYSEIALGNRLVIELERAEPQSAEADHVDTMEFCRQRILAALKPAIEDLSTRGRPHQVGLHAAVSRLALCYGHLTGLQPSYWGDYRSKAWSEDDDTPASPFTEFARDILTAAGCEVPFNALHQAIERYCRARNATQPEDDPSQANFGGNERTEAISDRRLQ